MKYVIAFAASIFVAISSAVAEPLVLGTTKGSANYQTGLALSKTLQKSDVWDLMEIRLPHKEEETSIEDSD